MMHGGLANALRRTAVLASALKQEALAAWVRDELNGYAGRRDEIPDYRRTPAMHRGHFVGGFGMQLKNAQIPVSALPAEMRDAMQEYAISDPIGTIEQMAKGEHGEFRRPWPAGSPALLTNKVYEDLACLEAWTVVPAAFLNNIVEQVKNRLLDLTLRLRERLPGDGSTTPTLVTLPRGDVATIVQVAIYGGNNQIAAGASVAQTMIPPASGDVDALLAHLRRLGVPEEELDGLPPAIAGDGEPPSEGRLGERVRAWMKGAVGKAIDGAWSAGATAASTALEQAFGAFYGWVTGASR